MGTRLRLLLPHPPSPPSFLTSMSAPNSTSVPVSKNIVWHEGVSQQQREELVGQKGVTIWFTGLSASGKSTLACALELELLQKGKRAFRLDGDNVRFGLNKDLGFSPKDREENIRRVGEVAKLVASSCTTTLTAFISPYLADRALARKIHDESHIPFLEVFVDAPLEEVEKRDPKGLYAKARAGVIKGECSRVGLSHAVRRRRCSVSPAVDAASGSGSVC